MLDGLLGRSGFYTKCKSLIKQTRTRIDVVRRKRSATQKFLRKDIADLLANGLEKNAYGRADGLVSELILSSCYDFIDHVCEIILKHLPVLQKLRDCSEDCREAVASLMFAAARFSDLPELRELRDLFQARYGSSLEYYVNQKLVDNLTSKPPSMEKNIQLLQEIASEFSIRWDSRGFEERMVKSSINEQKHQQTPETRHTAQSKSSTPHAEDPIERNSKDDVLSKKRSEGSYQVRERQAEGRHKMESRRENILEREEEPKHNVAKTSYPPNNSYKPPLHKEGSIHDREDRDNYLQRRQQKAERRAYEENFAKEAIQTNGKKLESFDRQENASERDGFKSSLPQKNDQRSINNGKSSPSDLKNEPSENIHVRSMRRMQEDVTDGLKSNFRGGIPPPYVRPRKSKNKVDDDENDTLTFYPPGNGNRAETLPTQNTDACENGNGVSGFTEIYYKDESGIESTPRRRSHRRRHSRSSSTQDVNGDSGKEERVVRRVSTSRRKHESRKGLQVLFDDDHFEKDDEEKMIDKLLLHYSKKPSSSDNPTKSRKESKSRTTNEVMKSPVYNNKVKVVNDNRVEEDSTPRKETSRSMSFPPRQVSQPESTKVFARAASFQPDTPAKHVHPKLPDYDDLAARFAALRATKG